MNDVSILPLDHRIGANNPPEPIDRGAAEEDKRVADLIANATEWAKTYQKIEDEAVAKRVTDWINQLTADHQNFTAQFKAEKAPHEEKLKEVRDKWHPRLSDIEICLKAIKPLHRDWIRRGEEQRKATDAAARREAAEAQRRADQLAEQAKAGGPNVIAASILAREAAEEAEKARKAAAAVPQRTQIRGDFGGRTHSLRTVWYANIVEIDKTFAHYKGRAEVKELLTRLATADARNPRIWTNPAVRCIPGVYCYSEQE